MIYFNRIYKVKIKMDQRKLQKIHDKDMMNKLVVISLAHFQIYTQFMRMDFNIRDRDTTLMLKVGMEFFMTKIRKRCIMGTGKATLIMEKED